jgi:hypothetical protein
VAVTISDIATQTPDVNKEPDKITEYAAEKDKKNSPTAEVARVQQEANCCTAQVTRVQGRRFPETKSTNTTNEGTTSIQFTERSYNTSTHI